MASTLDEALSSSVSSDVSVIIPGTTPVISLSVSSDITSKTNNARLDVKQNGVLLFQTDAVTIGEGKLVHTCSQDETYMMEQGEISVQIHAITEDGVAWKTYPKTIQVGESLSTTIITKKESTTTTGGETTT